MLESPYGSMFSFDHIDCLHGSDPNPFDLTMVSFDFRLALKALYHEESAYSVNTGISFSPGSYFSSEAIYIKIIFKMAILNQFNKRELKAALEC